MSDVTQILAQIEQTDPLAADQLLPLVYEELRKLAASRLAHEKPGQTLQATALVHEAYVRLVQAGNPQQWDSKGHFFAAAAEAMRRILVDQACRKKSLRSGGNRKRISLSAAEPESNSAEVDLLGLDEALKKLETSHPRKAKLVKLRYFAGLTIEQAANSLQIATSTADADWVYAKGWLRLELEKNR
ncbi:ECF-type sigma factor [Stieleria sp. ICT_E10.1]|nr:ECF-type sigma factor [Stieleria sedimenti]